MLKGCYSHSFHSISTKLYCPYVGHEAIHGVTVCSDLPKLKKIWHFEIIVNIEPYGAGNFKTPVLL